MWFASWPDAVSLLIDAPSKDAAAAVAADAGGRAPARLVEVPPGVLAFEVYDREGAGDEDLMVVEPFGYSSDVLAALEDGETPEDASDAAFIQPCMAVAFDDEDRLVACELGRGHEGKHRNSARGAALVWE